MKINAFRRWVTSTMELRHHSSEVESRFRVIEILKRTCKTKSRTEFEKQEIRQYLSANLNCIPKSISSSEMDKLCDEIDYVPTLGRSVLFLQGDYGNVYYMIARGRVGLYVEPEKAKERNIEMNYGEMRTKPYTGTDEELSCLGEKGLTLQVRNMNNILDFFKIIIILSSYNDHHYSKEVDSVNMLSWQPLIRFGAVLPLPSMMTALSLSLMQRLTMWSYDIITSVRSNYRHLLQLSKSFLSLKILMNLH